MSALTTEAIESTIKRILVVDAYLEVEEDSILLTQELAGELGLDSLGFTELRVQCERRFSVRIPEEDFNSTRFRSVASVRDLIVELTHC